MGRGGAARATEGRGASGERCRAAFSVSCWDSPAQGGCSRPLLSASSIQEKRGPEKEAESDLGRQM